MKTQTCVESVVLTFQWKPLHPLVLPRNAFQLINSTIWHSCGKYSRDHWTAPIMPKSLRRVNITEITTCTNWKLNTIFTKLATTVPQTNFYRGSDGTSLSLCETNLWRSQYPIVRGVKMRTSWYVRRRTIMELFIFIFSRGDGLAH